jgi:hypothetical protein
MYLNANTASEKKYELKELNRDVSLALSYIYITQLQNQLKDWNYSKLNFNR